MKFKISYQQEKDGKCGIVQEFICDSYTVNWGGEHTASGFIPAVDFYLLHLANDGGEQTVFAEDLAWIEFEIVAALEVPTKESEEDKE